MADFIILVGIIGLIAIGFMAVLIAWYYFLKFVFIAVKVLFEFIASKSKHRDIPPASKD
jgi:hypothetical protein